MSNVGKPKALRAILAGLSFLLPQQVWADVLKPTAFVEGENAACINCHCCSGLGSFVGQIKIPPITGKYLFNSADNNIEVASSLSRHLITGYYPRLSLAPKQRFASKGGYVVRLGEQGGVDTALSGNWMVP